MVYGDLQCPYTKKFIQYKPRLEADFGQKIGLVLAHYPLNFHNEAKPAAIAAQCAAAQMKSSEFVDALLLRQKDLKKDVYIETATTVGITDLPAFTACLDGAASRGIVEADYAAGAAAGVIGTPYVYIAGKWMKRAYPYENFKAAIEGALSKRAAGKPARGQAVSGSGS